MAPTASPAGMELDFHKDPAILGRVIDAMADGLFTVDAQARFAAWNGGAERITGYTRDEVVGQPCRLLEGPNCQGFATLEHLLKNPALCGPDGVCHQQCKLMAKDGREIYIHGNVRLVFDAQGHVSGAVGSFTDLTAFILANQKIAVLERQSREQCGQLVGRSAAMQEVFRRLHLAAHSDVSVFISGESGTGKELAARAVHGLSNRSGKPFIAINCSAIPENLLESELFGHVRGAFTGAIKDKLGMFQAADGGTLFLDEIGDISPLLQLKLLRVLQEREIRRVGDERPQKVNVRLITATNRDLRAGLEAGTFREDFYFRIHVFEIRMPPLRERREDIALLADHLIRELAKVHRRPVQGLTREALDCLLRYSWPGNVRELRNAIEHAFVTVTGDRITLLDLPREIRAPLTPEATDQPPLQTLSPEELEERARMTAALEQTGGNRAAAARLLGISRVTFWKKAKKYQLAED